VTGLYGTYIDSVRASDSARVARWFTCNVDDRLRLNVISVSVDQLDDQRAIEHQRRQFVSKPPTKNWLVGWTDITGTSHVRHLITLPPVKFYRRLVYCTAVTRCYVMCF